MPIANWETITGEENLLILATHPGDETQGCGGLIAQSCRRGRPPFVLVLTDGCIAQYGSAPNDPQDALAALLERRTQAAARALRLPAGRLLMAGLYHGHVPTGERDVQAIVHGITMIMWARDCNVICAPAPAGMSVQHLAAHRIAAAVAAASGVGHLGYHLPPADPLQALRLDIRQDLAAKRAALADHQADPTGASRAEPSAHECFTPIFPTCVPAI